MRLIYLNKFALSKGSNYSSGGKEDVKSSYPKEFKDACAEQDEPHYADYQHYNIEYGMSGDYEKLQKLGRGKYSEVYSGLDINNERVVMKFLKPIKREKLNREVKIMTELRGGPFINSLKDIVRDEATKSPVLITEFLQVSHANIKEIYAKITPFEIKYYIYKILIGLRYAHSKGIMHRDIKPHNILVNTKTQELQIIDWGLAEFYVPDKDYHPRVASRFFKGPELLVGYPYYHYSLDIWSLGCMLAGIIFKREPFFRGSNNDDQLVKITKVLGTESLEKYLHRYNIVLDEVFDEIMGTYNKKSWDKFINEDNDIYTTEDAIDLIDKMLVMDHGDRITVTEAMHHPYFDEVREVVESELSYKMYRNIF